MKPQFLALLALTLLSAGCLEKTAPGQVPSAFFYKGDPVDPYCFADSSSMVGAGSVSLDVCTGKSKSKPSYNQNNFYGMELDDVGGMIRPYVYYKYIGPMGDDHLIHLVSSSGGTAQFSDLRVVTLDGNLLRTKRSLAGGDRCNGGIDSASMSETGALSYHQNITPHALMSLTGSRTYYRVAQGMQDCAACCIGTANYDEHGFAGVTLTRDPVSVKFEDLKAKDACFYGTYNEVYKTGRTLDLAQLKVMGETIEKRCSQLR